MHKNDVVSLVCETASNDMTMGHVSRTISTCDSTYVLARSGARCSAWSWGMRAMETQQRKALLPRVDDDDDDEDQHNNHNRQDEHELPMDECEHMAREPRAINVKP